MSQPEAHESFLNHIMSCPSCNGISARYCDTGRTLWIEDQAAFIAAQETRQEQAYWFKELRVRRPEWADAVGERVKVMLGSKA